MVLAVDPVDDACHRNRTQSSGNPIANSLFERSAGTLIAEELDDRGGVIGGTKVGVVALHTRLRKIDEILSPCYQLSRARL